ITLAVISGLVTLTPLLWSALRSLPAGQIFPVLWPRFAALGLVILTAVWLVASVTPMPWGVVAFGRYFATWASQLAPGIVNPANVPSDPGAPDRFCLYVGEGMNVSLAVTQTREGWRSFHGAGE